MPALKANAKIENTVNEFAFILKQNSHLMRLVHLSSLKGADDVTLLLRKQVAELVEAVARNLAPRIIACESPAANSKAIVIAIAVIVYSGQSFSHIFGDEFKASKQFLSAYSGFFWILTSNAGNRAFPALASHPKRCHLSGEVV
jgi:hypothetical protein